MSTYLTTKEAAAFLRVTVRAIEKMVASRKFPVYKPTRKILIAKEDLENFIESKKIHSREETETMAANFHRK